MQVLKDSWTKTQADFVGTKFVNNQGNKVLITGVHKFKSGVKYSLDCEVCSRDTDLHPLILASKGHLLSGKFPCQCSGRFKPNEDQLTLLVKRELESLGYIGCRLSGDFKGKEHTWFTTHDPYAKKDKKVKSKCVLGKQMTPLSIKYQRSCETWDNFTSSIKDYYPAYVKISKDLDKVDKEGHRLFYKYHCPICENMFGIPFFHVRTSSLCVGQIPCMCNIHKILDTSQKKLLINYLFSKENHTLHCYDEDTDRVIWSCEHGHQRTTLYQNFVNKGSRCKVCRDYEGHVYNGYYENFKERPDILYLFKITDQTTHETFVKIGRSFNVSSRKTNIPYLVEVEDTYQDSHENIYKIEQDLLERTKASSYIPLKRFKGDTECRSLDTLPFIKELFTNI